MTRTDWAPAIVPYGADQTLYLVVDHLEPVGGGHREIEFERTELETVIAELMSGQFSDPLRVVAFNTLEHWFLDISGDVAAEIQTRCDIEGVAIPEHLQDFVASQAGPARESVLRPA